MSVDNSDQPCRVCKLIRVYLFVAVPVLFFLWLRPEVSLLAGVDLIGLSSKVVGVGLVAVVAWRAYIEFWKRDRD